MVRRDVVAVAMAAAVGAAACGGAAAPEPGGVVRIMVAYPGAGAGTIEGAVLEPIERAVSGVAHVTGYRGVAGPDLATVDVRFARGIDRDVALEAVLHAITPMLTTLPAEAQQPVISGGRPTSWVYATVPADATEAARRALETTANVALVEICGLPNPTVAIDLDPLRLAARGISVRQVMTALTAANIELPAGRLETTSDRLNLRLAGRMSSVADVSALIVGPTGERLQDIADVRLDDVPRCQAASGLGYPLLRVGLRGTDDDRARARREVQQRLRDHGALVFESAPTIGVADADHPADARGWAIEHWAPLEQGAYAVATAAPGRIVLLWPDGDPRARATAAAVAGLERPAGVGPPRWTAAAAPLIEATIVGEDSAALVVQALAAVRALGDIPSIAAADCTPCRAGVAMRLELDRDLMARLGVSAAEVADVARLLRPQHVASLSIGAAAIDVTIGVRDVDRWLDLPVTAEGGAVVRLRGIANARSDHQPDEVMHIDGRRAVTVWAQGKPGVSAATVRAALARVLPTATLAPADLRALEASPWTR